MAGSEDKVANDATEDSSDPISDVQSTQGVTESDEKNDNDAAEDSTSTKPNAYLSQDPNGSDETDSGTFDTYDLFLIFL